MSSSSNQIKCQSIGRKFGKHWVFKNLDLKIDQHTAIIGPNGSGKSTLIKSLIGSTPINTGEIEFFVNQNKFKSSEEIHPYFSLTAPYFDLIEEFTTVEMVQFYWTFKPHLFKDQGIKAFLNEINLWKDRFKHVKDFSSGMKQRLKLGLCLYSEVPFIFLDEPTSNLDDHYKAWFQQVLQKRKDETIFIIASNDEFEYSVCNISINISNFL